jgi:hypothetical protein
LRLAGGAGFDGGVPFPWVRSLGGLWARDAGALAGRSGIDRGTTSAGLKALACRGTVKLSATSMLGVRWNCVF